MEFLDFPFPLQHHPNFTQFGLHLGHLDLLNSDFLDNEHSLHFDKIDVLLGSVQILLYLLFAILFLDSGLLQEVAVRNVDCTLLELIDTVALTHLVEDLSDRIHTGEALFMAGEDVLELRLLHHRRVL